MKKLLGAALVLTMGVACVGALAACDSCGGNKANDAEAAKKAIQSIRVIYADKAVETPETYTVMGQTKVDKVNYTVNWSVSSATFNNLSDYVSVGAMDETSNLVTVSVTKADEAIEYKLKASVTVGKETETVEFNRKVPAKPVAHDGTKENPYSVANVVEIANKMTPKAKLEESDNPVAVYVKGYIVDCGTDQPTNNRVGYVYIVDEYSEDKNSKSPDALMILSINYDTENLTGYSDLKKGNEIMVKGYIMNYQKAGTTTTQPEVTYYGSNGVTCEYLQKVEKTDAEKVAAAKEAVDLSVKLFTEVTTTGIDLPATNNGASLSWEVDSDLVTIDDNKLNIVKIPDAETPVTIKVTITCGDESDAKEIVIKVVKASDIVLDHAGTEADPYSLADVSTIGIGSDLDSTKLVYIEGYITDKGTGTSYLTNVKIADVKDDTANSININSIDFAGDVTSDNLHVGDKVVISGFILNNNGAVQIGKNGSTFAKFVKLVECTDNGGPTITTSKYGTLEAPLSVTEALALAGDECKADKDVTAQVVYMKGVITDAGEAKGAYYQNVYIGDLADSSKTILVYTINLREGVPAPVVGKEVVISGYIKNFSGTIEFASNSGRYVYIESSADDRTDAEKAQAALNALNIPANVTGDIDLKSSVAGVTLTLVSDNTAAIANDGKVTRPAAGENDVTVNLTVTATIGEEHPTKDFTVTVKAEVAVAAGTEAKLDLKANFGTFGSDWGTQYKLHEVTFAQAGVSNVEGTISMSNADSQAENTFDHPFDDVPVLASKGNTQYVTVTSEAAISAVEFDLKQWNTKTYTGIYIEYFDGTDWKMCSATITTPGKLATNVAIPAGVTKVRLVYSSTGTSNVQMGLNAITLTLA